MRKLVVLLCFVILAMTLVMACKPPGALCGSDKDCCGNFGCNPFSTRCSGRPGMATGNPWGPGGSLSAGIPRGPAY